MLREHRSPWRRGAFFVLVLGALGCNLFEDIARDLCDDVLVVNKTEDSLDDLCNPEDCSLRDAVFMSNACEGTQTIHIPAGTYRLTLVGPGEDLSRTGDLDIIDSVILRGDQGEEGPLDYSTSMEGAPGWTFITGDFLGPGTSTRRDRILHIHASATDVQVSGILMTAGRVESDRLLPRGGVILNQGGLEYSDGFINHGDVAVADAAGSAMAGGAGLFNEGTAVLRNVEVAGNYTYHDVDGAGIHNAGVLLLEEVDVHGNETEDGGVGGGLYNAADAEATIINSTFSNNEDGGGPLPSFGHQIANLGNLVVERSAISTSGREPNIHQSGASASAQFTNTTVSGVGPGFSNETGPLLLNSVTLAAGMYGAGITSSGDTRLVNSIISGELVACSGDPPVSLGHNLDNDGSCGLDVAGDLSGLDPRLVPLPVGGPRFASLRVHQLAPGSPAIDAGAPSGTCPATDQRGVARPLGAGCDIGAYESSTGELAPTLVTTPGLVPTPGSVPTAVGLATSTPLGSPTATFRQNTNCRAGPSTLYDILRSFLQGETATVEGRNDSEPRWWWLLIPGSNAHCWVSGSTVDLDFPGDHLAVIDPPPLPTATSAPEKPAAPEKLAVTDKVCNASAYSVTLGWNDVANNEDGYRVYRSGTLIATLSTNATSYADDPPGSGPYTYGVEAFNDAGASKRPTVNEDGCLY